MLFLVDSRLGCKESSSQDNFCHTVIVPLSPMTVAQSIGNWTEGAPSDGLFGSLSPCTSCVYPSLSCTVHGLSLTLPLYPEWGFV